VAGGGADQGSGPGRPHRVSECADVVGAVVAKPNLELLGAKYGLSPVEALSMENKVGAIAHRDGLPFTSDRVLVNSFDVHRVLANTIGLADQLLGDLQRTLFSGRANVYDHTVLADFASRHGIPRSRVEEVLSSNEYADAVRADEKEAKTLGATGVPFTVFDGRIAIPARQASRVSPTRSTEHGVTNEHHRNHPNRNLRILRCRNRRMHHRRKRHPSWHPDRKRCPYR
jgi:hypothetical protein